VSRALASLLALTLTGALGLAGTGSISGSGLATAADCAWQQHSKRVVKRILRDGKTRRVVRTRHWWTCNQLAAAPVIEPPPAPISAPSPQPEPEPAPTIEHLGVKAEDKAEKWSFTLSHSSVAAGEVIVELNNQGGDPHNLNLRREGEVGPPLEVAEAGPLEHRTGRFTLAAGTYKLWCSLPEHEEKGMHTTLVVGGG